MAHVTRTIEVAVESEQHETLTDAAESVASDLGVEVWQCEARWYDDQREQIVVAVGLHEDDEARLGELPATMNADDVAELVERLGAQ